MSKNSKKLKRYIRKQIKKYVQENNVITFTKLPEMKLDKNRLPTTKLKVTNEITEIPPHNTWTGCAH